MVKPPIARLPTLKVTNAPTAIHGQQIALLNLVTINDPNAAGYQKLELWELNGTVAGGRFVVNGLPQTGGQEIDLSSVDVAHTVFDVGTLGGTDKLWARLLQNDGTLSKWQQFSVRAPTYTFSVVDPPASTNGSLANSINNADQIVGRYTGNAGVHGFLYSGGTYTTLDYPLSISTYANGINDLGQIVGTYVDASDKHGFLYSGGAYTTIDAPGNVQFAELYSINDAGQMIGFYQDNIAPYDHSFLYSNGNFTIVNDPAARVTIAQDINNAGQIVGWEDKAVTNTVSSTATARIPPLMIL